MKQLTLVLSGLLLLPLAVHAGGSWDNMATTEYFMTSQKIPDTTVVAVYQLADSVEISVAFQDGTIAHDSVWYNSGDAASFVLNNRLYFTMLWSSLNGTKGNGTYTVTCRWYKQEGTGYDIQEAHTVRQTSNNAGNVNVASADSAYKYDAARFIWKFPLKTTTYDFVDSTFLTGDSVMAAFYVRLGDTAFYINADGLLDFESDSGSVEFNASNTTTQLQTNLASTEDDYWIGGLFYVQEGTEIGQAATITGYVGSTGTLTLTPALADVPIDAIGFRIFPRGHVEKILAIAAGAVDAAASPLLGRATAWITDTLPVIFGMPGNTIDAISRVDRGTTLDTTWIVTGSYDTIGWIRYFLDGSGKPDSAKAVWITP